MGVFIPFSKVTSGGINCGLFQKVTKYYVIVAIDENWQILQLFGKLMDLKILKL